MINYLQKKISIKGFDQISTAAVDMFSEMVIAVKKI